MKRPRTLESAVKSYSVRSSLSPKQLECIGAIAMVYNEAEAALDEILGACLVFPGNNIEITSRINGSDGKIKIIEAGIAEMPFPPDTLEALTIALQSFASCKTYRDAVVHSRVLDQRTDIGVTKGQRGKVNEVLLKPEALEWLFEQIGTLENELDSLADAVNAAHRIRRQPEVDPEHKARLEQSIRDATAQCLVHQRRRQSKTQPPKFPTESEVEELQKGPIRIHV